MAGQSVIVHVSSPTEWWQVAAAVGAMVGGVGAAVGGVSAAVSARASRATGRDALEALAIATQPYLGLDSFFRPPEGQTLEDPGPTFLLGLRITTESAFGASDIALEVTFSDGHRRHERFERVSAEPGASGLEVVLGEVPRPPELPAERVNPTSAILRYSDERGIARYEEAFGFWSTQHGDGSPATPSYNVAAIGQRHRVK